MYKDSVLLCSSGLSSGEVSFIPLSPVLSFGNVADWLFGVQVIYRR